MRGVTWFTVIQVRQNIFALAEFHHFEKVVSFLVVGKKKALLFDTGMGYADIYRVVRSITPLPLHVFLTHTHWDHIGGVRKDLDIYIYDDPFEKKLLQKGFTTTDIAEMTDQEFFGELFHPKKYHVKGVRNFRAIHDGDEFSFSDATVSIIHTPGHTPGSVCYYLPTHDALISGDTLYPGPLYAHLPESNARGYASSLDKLLNFVSQDTVVLPGHNQMAAGRKLLESAVSGFAAILSRRAVPAIMTTEYNKYDFPDLSILVKP